MNKIDKTYTLNEFNRLVEICQHFDNHNPNDKLYFAFIAPVNNNDIIRFMWLVRETPTISASFYEVLSNFEYIKDLLIKHFNDDIELSVYVATNDKNTAMFEDFSLNDFIDKVINKK